MSRGFASAIGEERTSQNGYLYVKTPQGWRLKHLVIVERMLGRSLYPMERIRFKDGNKKNLDLDNLDVVVKKSKTVAARVAWLEAKIEELQAELDELRESVET